MTDRDIDEMWQAIRTLQIQLAGLSSILIMHLAPDDLEKRRRLEAVLGEDFARAAERIDRTGRAS